MGQIWGLIDREMDNLLLIVKPIYYGVIATWSGPALTSSTVHVGITKVNYK